MSGRKLPKRKKTKTSWYLQHMPPKRWQRVAIIVTGLFLAIIIAFQLSWPADRGLPLARVGNQSLALADYEKMAGVIVSKFESSKIELKIGNDKSVESSLKKFGAEPNTDKMIDSLSGYPWWARLIPGSILLQPAQIDYADVYYSYEIFTEFSKKTAEKLTFEAQNARLNIENGQVVTTEATASSSIKSEVLQEIISSSQFVLGGLTVIDVPAERKAAERSSRDLAAVRSQAEAVLNHAVTIMADSQAFSPDRNTIASWVVLASDKNGDVTISIDQAKIKEYLAGINEKVGTPAGQTDIQIVDGREVSRVTGVNGRHIDSDKLAGELASALREPTMDVQLTAQFVETQPSVIYNSQYTATEAGLRAYVRDVAYGRNMWISIVQLDGQKWTAAAREHESIPSGSTFKLYVALMLFDKMDKGEISWGDPILDTNVDVCFNRMTIASTNPCAEKWIADFGRQDLNNFIYAHGFSTGTSFITGGAVATTAADLTKFMIGLHNGSLLNGPHRDRLLLSLRSHIYRYGIPTGSAGVVHDKVGFLWGYVHDTAIVQHPRGTYVMTIMTNGGSYAPIASVTREVERIMYP